MTCSGKQPETSRLFRGAVAVVAAVIAMFCGAPQDVASDTMMWLSNFPAIALGQISHQGDIVEGSSLATLLLSGDVEMTADNSTAARLSGSSGDILVTEYKLTFDGNGVAKSGGNTVNYASYDTFISPGVLIQHVSGDDAVDVTLHVRARNQDGKLADAGAYAAHQALTVTWLGP